MTRNRLGAAIRELRLQNNMSALAAGDALGVSAATIRRLEDADNPNLDAHLLWRLACLVGMEREHFLCRLGRDAVPDSCPLSHRISTHTRLPGPRMDHPGRDALGRQWVPGGGMMVLNLNDSATVGWLMGQIDAADPGWHLHKVSQCTTNDGAGGWKPGWGVCVTAGAPVNRARSALGASLGLAAARMLADLWDGEIS